MDIWEPCNYASNLAYDRLMLEMCLQEDWAFSPQTVGVNARFKTFDNILGKERKNVIMLIIWR